jgi:hypothetical protein
VGAVIPNIYKVTTMVVLWAFSSATICNWIENRPFYSYHHLPTYLAWTHTNEHNNHGTNISCQWTPTPSRTRRWRNCGVWTPLDGAIRHTTPHTMANHHDGDCCGAGSHHSEQIWTPHYHGLILTCLGSPSLVVVVVGSVAVGPIFVAFCRFPFNGWYGTRLFFRPIW